MTQSALRQLTLFTSLTLLSSVPAGARPPGPSQEMWVACQGLAEGAVCTFDWEGTARTGSCRNGPQGEPAACLPERPAQGPQHGPPREAIEACDGLTASAACRVTLGSDTRSGSCKPAPDGTTLACRPDGMHRPH